MIFTESSIYFHEKKTKVSSKLMQFNQSHNLGIFRKKNHYAGITGLLIGYLTAIEKHTSTPTRRGRALEEWCRRGESLVEVTTVNFTAIVVRVGDQNALCWQVRIYWTPFTT